MKELISLSIDPSKTCVIQPIVKSKSESERNEKQKLAESCSLALSIQLNIVVKEIVFLNKIHPATYMGAGKVEELKALLQVNQVQLTIVNTHLSPSQQRNLEKEWNCKVIDRTALILEIFGARARTQEGKLQVELASLEYQRSRLVRSWTHLERQRGGFGFVGGPGETQKELDRRLIVDRIVQIKNDLQTVVRTRALHRQSREATPYPIIALVGYTNAGKSTLFNHLTNANVLAEDKLFATLDPTMRLYNLKSKRQIILSDTVGFISDLPTQLVASFKATLEEVCRAQIILHVRDITHPETEAQKQDVLEILNNLGLSDKIKTQLIEVHNKIDKYDEWKQTILINKAKEEGIAAISAIKGIGIDSLLEQIENLLGKNDQRLEVIIPTADGKTINWLHQNSVILNSKLENDDLHLTVQISEINESKFIQKINTHHYKITKLEAAKEDYLSESAYQ